MSSRSLRGCIPKNTTNAQTASPAPAASVQQHQRRASFEKCPALFFSHQKWNTTLSHSLKSTKVNYPSFTQLPVGQGAPIYLGPDVSMSQLGDSRPQKELLTSLWLLWFQGASDSACRPWHRFTCWLLILPWWHNNPSAFSRASLTEKKSIILTP